MTVGEYAGFFLEIDLTARRAVRKALPDSYRQKDLGGKALAAQLMWDSTSGTETAFSGENPVIFAAALLTGTDAPGSARFDVAALSPKDDLPAFSNCGGDFGRYLKEAGCDALLIKGKADSPLWLELSGQGVCFHDAQRLWGRGTGQCRGMLEEKLPKQRFASVCIGPAGENLVKFASLVADGHSTGRAGLGAVLGWKNLKAVTVSALQEQSEERDRQLLPGDSFCRGCSLHCIRHSRKEASILDELGLDAIAAEAALSGAAVQGLKTEDLYEAIAFRSGIGDRLAEATDCKKRKNGKRRSESYGKIAKAFGLPAEEENTREFCGNFLEAVSACGQCMFTVNALQPGLGAQSLLHLMESVTGQPWDLNRLLTLGTYSRELERQLKIRFLKQKTPL